MENSHLAQSEYVYNTRIYDSIYFVIYIVITKKQYKLQIKNAIT